MVMLSAVVCFVELPLFRFKSAGGVLLPVLAVDKESDIVEEFS